MSSDGAVRSTQTAYVTLPKTRLEEIWSPAYLERLARAYWRYLSSVTLGLVQVHYTPTERAIVLIGRPIVLLRFRAPRYAIATDGGSVRWVIRSGLLVAARANSNDGYLELRVRRMSCQTPELARVHVELTVANFYPALAFALPRWAYQQTQSRIHVLIAHGFLRSLRSIEFERSVAGQFDRINGHEANLRTHRGSLRDHLWIIVLSAGIIFWRLHKGNRHRPQR